MSHTKEIDLADRCRTIDVLLMDVDGVLTDGSIVYGHPELEIKAFHVRDGSALKLWTRLGKKAGVLTGRTSAIVDRRARELDFQFIVQGAADKRVAFEKLLVEYSLDPATIAYIGDDFVDLPVMRRCGLAIAVADACPEARQDAHYVTQARGGRGAVREVVEWILRRQGLWQTVIENHRR